ncbi:serine proteinase [Oscillospiraceae bacterium 50-16]
MDFKDTFDSLKDRATDLAQAGVAQSRRLAEIAKLKMANMSEEDAIKKAYLEIGKLYYAEQGAAPDGAYAAACERITASKAAIETNNERIAELKQSGDPEETETAGTEEESSEPAESVEAPAASEDTPLE